MEANNTSCMWLIATTLLILNGCSTGTMLSARTRSMNGPARGAYDLILYGGQNPRDFRTVAILDRADDQYRILPFGAEFNYRVLKEVPAKEALTEGNRFIGAIEAYRSTEIREIAGPDNSVIGYELHPLYLPLTTGWLGDLLTTSYFLNDGKSVTVYIGFKGEYWDKDGGTQSSPVNTH